MKKIAVITGASSGMGREFVIQLEREKQLDEIWVIARRRDRLEALQNDVKTPIRAIALDLTKEESFAEYRALLEAEKPTVDVLVNASGFGKFGSFEDMDAGVMSNMIDLNVKAYVAMTYATLPYLTKGSEVYQLDSLSSFQPVPYIAVYGATKSFVFSYSRACNAELKGTGIRMMAMNPGWVKTEFFQHAFGTNDGQVQYFDRLYEAEDVVRTGLKDLYKTKKEYSVHGFMTRMQVRLVKLLPHNIVMSIWMNQQKKAKNNTNLK